MTIMQNQTLNARARLAHLLAQVDVALLDAKPESAAADAPLVTFTDGTLRHRVRNTRERLTAYRAQLTRCEGFRADPGETKRVRARWQKQGLRATSCGLASNAFLGAEFADMWDEENARELARCILGPNAATATRRDHTGAASGEVIGEPMEICGFPMIVERVKLGNPRACWRVTEPESGMHVGAPGHNRNQAVANAREACERAGANAVRRAITDGKARAQAAEVTP